MALQQRPLYLQAMPLTDRLLELTVAAATFFTLAAPRGAFIYLTLTMMAALVATRTTARPISEGDGFRARLARIGGSQVGIAAIAFLAYAALSATWAVDPVEAFAKSLQAAGLLAVLFVTLIAIGRRAPISCWLAARGVCHGAVLGLAYILVEHATDGTIKALLVNQTGLLPAKVTFNVVKDGAVAAIDNTFLNRHSAALVLLAWPVAASLRTWLADRPDLARLGSGIWLVAAAIAAFVSESETAKLAVLAGAALYGVACRYPQAAFWIAAAAWSALTLGIVPLLLAIFPPGNALQSKLPFSAEDRVIVWQYTIAQLPSAPLFGVGANMTPVLHEREKAADEAKSEAHVPRLAQHAHNAFLQTWFELGATGAVLLCALGLAALGAIAGFTPAARTFGYAFFASATAVASTGYGMWQVWLIAVGLLAIAILALAFRDKGAGMSDAHPLPAPGPL